MDVWKEFESDSSMYEDIGYLEPELETAEGEGCHCAEDCPAHYNLA